MSVEFVQTERIAYFTMEIALQSDIPTYAGGLGILAGDTVRSAADLDIPLVTVSLVSRAGYFRQELGPGGHQIERPDVWEPAQHARPLEARVSVPIEGRTVWVGGFLFVLESERKTRQPVLLLDTDLADNNEADRQITHHLYGGDASYRLKQEIVLGIGGTRMLHALGFRIREYHMNEGHSAFLTLELMRRYSYEEHEVRPGEALYDLPRVRDLCNFTTHTPVEAGHDRFAYDLVERTLGDFVDLKALKKAGGEAELNMTRLALNLSEYVNGVAKRHAEVSQKMFPGYRVRAITNGVHPNTWTSPGIAALFDRYLPGWRHEPELLVRADCCIPGDALWQAHTAAKAALRDKVALLCGVRLDPTLPVLGFARRMTAYKRPDLLFSDLDRLTAIARKFPFQLVMSGKAHPRDAAGKQLIAELHSYMAKLRDVLPMAYLPNYDMSLAMLMVAGVDVWLNTPLRPQEASGTSGMKAAFNGVPSLSILDGWWVEGCIEGVTGWSIGDGVDGPISGDALSLYEKLGEIVLPLFYRDRAGWIRLMQTVIAKNAPFFNSHHMMRRYASDAYIR